MLRHLFMLTYVFFIFFISSLFCRSFLSFLLLLELVVMSFVFFLWSLKSLFYSLGLSMLVIGVAGASMGLALLMALFNYGLATN